MYRFRSVLLCLLSVLLLTCNRVPASSQATYVPSNISDISGLQTVLNGAVQRGATLLDRPQCFTGCEWESGTAAQDIFTIPTSSGNIVSATYRSYHAATTACHDIRIVLRNTWNYERGLPTGNITCAESIEFSSSFGLLATTSSGTILPVTWAGSHTVVIPPGGIAVSDPVTIEVPQGGILYCRNYVSVPTSYSFIDRNGNPHTGAGTGGAGWGMSVIQDNNTYGTGNNIVIGGNSSNAAPDITLSGSFLTAIGVYQYVPAAIIAEPSTPQNCVAIWGDSLTTVYPTANNPTGLPLVDSALAAAHIPYIDCGQGGETLHQLVTSQFTIAATGFNPLYRQARTQLATGCKYVILHEGTNDIFTGSLTGGNITAATLEADYLQFASVMSQRGMKVYLCTILPRIGAVYTSTGAQTANLLGSNVELVREAVNTWMRTTAVTASGGTIAGILDTAGAIEADVNNNLTNGTYSGGAPWAGQYQYCGPGNNTSYFSDGTHLTNAGVALCAANINTNLFK